MTRTVGHRTGRIMVFAYADSIAEALALEAALKQVPKAEAFLPVFDSVEEAQAAAEIAPPIPPAVAAYAAAADPPMPEDVLKNGEAHKCLDCAWDLPGEPV